MEANIIQIILTIIGVAVIGCIKFYQQKYGSDPEAWNLQKFAMLIVVAIVVIAAEYLYGNTITFPSEDIIVGVFGVFGAAYTLITGGKLVKSVVTSTPSPGSWSPGFTVTPAFQKGKSQFTAAFQATVGMSSDLKSRCQLIVDWQDGTGKETIPISDKDGMASFSHTFEYVKGDSKYTGHSFYPVFYVIQNDGTTQTFNVQNKCCEVEVQS